ncbi:MAG: hypothetical protein O3C28_15690 [Proteobacteria bacterium]|nr:hypothetical protein [Pseudomonadota bacterium]
MKHFSSICLVVGLLIVTNSASAGGYGRGGYGHHGHGHGGHHYGSNAGFLVGGLLLGSLLSQPRYPAVQYYPSPQVVYVQRPVQTVVSYAPPPVATYAPPRSAPISGLVGRRLLRDINGNCFERKTNQQGTELQVQLPPGECVW